MSDKLFIEKEMLKRLEDNIRYYTNEVEFHRNHKQAWVANSYNAVIPVFNLFKVYFEALIKRDSE